MTDDPRLKVLADHASRWCREGDWARERLAELDAVDDLRRAPGKDAVEAALDAWFEGCPEGMPHRAPRSIEAMSRALAAALPALHARIAELEPGTLVWRRPEEWAPLTDRNAVRKILVEGTDGAVWYLTMYAGVGTRTSWRRWVDATPPPWVEPIATPATDRNAPRVSASSGTTRDPGVAGVAGGAALRQLAIIGRCCSRCRTERLSLPGDPSDSCPECHCAAWHDTKRYLSENLILAIRGETPNAE